MAIVLTAAATVRDWSALSRLYRESLLEYATDAGASGCRLYRNVRDASRALIVVELADDEAAADLDHRFARALATLSCASDVDGHTWETIGDSADA